MRRILPLLTLLAATQLSCGGGDVEMHPRWIPVPVTVETTKREPFAAAVEAWGTLSASEEVTLSTPEGGQVTFPDGPPVLGGEVAQGEVIAVLRNRLLELQAAADQRAYEVLQQRLKKYQPLYDQGYLSARDLEEAKLELERARTAKLLSEEKVRSLTVRSPLDGRVSTVVPLVEGQEVPAGQEICSVSGGGELVLELQVPEEKRSLLRAGLPVTIHRREGDPPAAEGQTSAIAPDLDPETHAVTVEVRLPASASLVAGDFVLARILYHEDENAMSVPREAVLRDGERSHVYVTQQRGTYWRAMKRYVETGPVSGSRIQIVTGLEDGEKVIVGGVRNVHDDTRVEVKEIP
jgi:RND family efflux transporter MFP subunit